MVQVLAKGSARQFTFGSILVFFILLGRLPYAYGGSEESIAKLINAEKSGVFVLNDSQGRILFEHRKGRGTVIPASVQKITLALVALRILGEEYRFKTEWYISSSGDLRVVGFGDPFLISEEIDAIAQHLKSLNQTTFGSLIIDDSQLVPTSIDGVSNTSRAYDALTGALLVNFNTLHIGRNAAGTIFSAEEQTPLTPLAKARGLKVVKKGQRKRINLSANYQDTLSYAGELITSIFAKRGIGFDRSFVVDKQSQQNDDLLLYRHYNSRSLSGVLQAMLQYSNNVIANQIVFAVGARKLGYPIRFSDAVAALNTHIQEITGLSAEDIYLAEGSGISRQNFVRVPALLRILEAFKPHHTLLSKRAGIYTKSGTLRGIYAFAGYVDTPGGLRSYFIQTPSVHLRDQLFSALPRLSAEH